MRLSTTFAAAMLVTAPALAFDGWHLLDATVIPGVASGWDYISFDTQGGHVYLGHRKDGLQVFDPRAKKVVATITDTAAHSSNGATLIPEFDLGISNNEDGTITPFKISTHAASPAVKLAEEIDTSHYDPATKRIVVNVNPGKDGTELVVLQAPKLDKVGTIKVPSRKAEGAVADGKGKFFLAEQDLGKIAVLDTKEMKVTAEWTVAGCGKPTGMDVDPATDRLFVSCRSTATTKPAFVVLKTTDGSVVFSVEIGDGSDGVIYDAVRHRIFSANGVHANLSVIEQVDADHYKLVETLGTRAGVKVLAFDAKANRLYSMVAEGSADAGKKINTAVSPYYANTFLANTFTVLTYGK